jgi:c-di-AMP phosphodiesterase-like protein
MEDKQNILKDETLFTYKKIKENKALIFWKNKLIKTIYGEQYEKLKKLEEKDNTCEIQLYLARITGNFKYGNKK